MDGSKLKKLREDKGYSLTKISELTGISKSYLSLIERGIQTNPSLDILEKIAIALETDVETIVRNVNSSNGREPPTMNKLKVEIELSKEQLSPNKLKRIKELIDEINTE